MKKLFITLITLIAISCLSSNLIAGPNEDLVEAIELQDIEKLKSALDAGADPNHQFEHYLLWQLNRTQFKKFTPLMLASANGFDQGVLYLLHSKAKVNATAKGGVSVYFERVPVSSVSDVTALHLACGNGHAEVVKLLLQAKAKKISIMAIKAKSSSAASKELAFVKGVANYTPQKWAKDNGQEEILALLKESKKAQWMKDGLPAIGS